MFRKITHELKGIRSEMVSCSTWLRRISDGLQDIPEGGADADRLSALEGRFEVVLGQVEAGIIKAEALKAAALASESRADGHRKRGDKAFELAKSLDDGEDEDPFEQAARAYADQLSEANGEVVDPVYGVRPGVEGGGPDLDAIRAAKRAR